MLTAIRIGNFKAFAETQRIPIRPLTLIYGANSSGKSSVLHSLLLARHAQESQEDAGLDVHKTTIGGDSVDLGGFRQFIYNRNISKRMGWSAELNTSSFTGRLAQLLAPVARITVSLEIGLPLVEEMKEQESIDPRTDKKILIKVPSGNLVPTGNPEVLSYLLLGDEDPLLRMSKRRDGRLQLDRLNHEHIVFREVLKAIVQSSTTTEELHPDDYAGLDNAISEIVPDITAAIGNLLPQGLVKSDAYSSDQQPSLFPISRGRRTEDLAAAVRFFVPRTVDELIRGISHVITQELSKLQYLGPLRSYPPRHLAFSQYQDPNWFSGGGYAWDVVRRDTRVRDLVNAWLTASDRLHTKYELRIRHLLTIDDLKGLYHEKIEEIENHYAEEGEDPTVGTEENPGMDLFGDVYGVLREIEKGEERLSDIQELNLIDKRSGTVVSHRDVGIGVSQVLPVLVGAFASQNKIIAIEQPEIHLHPALQADLGDVFIESALGERKNLFLIETHSEHLLLRIMRRIRETTSGKLTAGCAPITPDDVMVLFVAPDGTQSVIHEMPLDKRGDLIKPWPGGFFEEDFRELF